MTSAESQPPSEPPELSKIYQDARRRNLLFWFLGIVWAVSILGLGFFFIYTTNQLRTELSKMGDVMLRSSFVLALSIQDKQSEGRATSTEERRYLDDTLKLLSERSVRYPEQILLLANRAFSDAERTSSRGSINRTKFKEAVRFYKKVLDIKEHDAGVMHRLGVSLHYTGSNRDALTFLNKEIEELDRNTPQPDESWWDISRRNTGYMWANNQKGLVQLQLSNYQDAIQSFQEARNWAKKLMPRPNITLAEEKQWKERYTNRYDGGFLENIGLVKIWQGKWNDAFNITDQVLEITHQTTWIWLIRAIAAEKMGQSSIAESAHEKWKSIIKQSRRDEAMMVFYLPRNLRAYVHRLP